MDTAPISLYFGVEKGKRADLETIARASLEWAGLTGPLVRRGKHTLQRSLAPGLCLGIGVGLFVLFQGLRHMNTPRSKPIKRFDKTRHPKNPDLPDPGVFEGGIKDEKMLLTLGKLISTWTHLEERMIYIFGILTKTEKGVAREIFRSVIAQEVKIKMMRFLLEETEDHAKKPPFFDKVLDEFKSLNTARNKYVHGLWYHDENATYLSSSDAARHPFETVTRKVKASDLDAFLERANTLAAAITNYQFHVEGKPQLGDAK